MTCPNICVFFTDQSLKGIAAVGEEIFRLRHEQQEVAVYDSSTLTETRSIKIPDMRSPQCLAGCSHHKVLYISDDEVTDIYRVDLINNSVTRWKMIQNRKPWGLSVTAENTLLVTVEICYTRDESGVVEYTTEGQQIREIRFDGSVTGAWHTVQLSSNEFIVSHGWCVSSLHRVCLINTEGQILKSYGRIKGKGEDSQHTSRSTVQVLEHGEFPIVGVTVVGDETFLVGEDQSQVKVYDSHSLRASRDIKIHDMTSPVGLAGCAFNTTIELSSLWCCFYQQLHNVPTRALYISDDEVKCIHRVDLTNNSVTRWKMRENHEPRGLSVTAEHTLLVTLWISGTRGESRVVEYTSEGQQMRVIRFDQSIKHAWQTVQLSSDQFIVSHGRWSDSPLHRVCVINAEGQIIKSFGREEGGGEDQLNGPRSLAIDEKSKHVFVADTYNNRVLMLDSELMTRLGEVHVSRDLRLPSRLYFDSSTDRLFVAGRIYSHSLCIVTHPELISD